MQVESLTGPPQLVGTGGGLQAELEVRGAARQRPNHGKVRLPQDARQGVAAHRQQAPRRLVAEDAAEVGWIADRAADVGADFQGRHTARQGRRGTARRTAGGTLQVPRVVGGAVQDVVALEIHQPQRHVRLAEDDRPGRLQPLHRQRVLGGNVVLQQRRAERRRQARQVERLLARHRHAVQRPPHLAARQRRVGLPGALAGAVGVLDDDGIDARIELLNVLQVVIEKLQATDLPVADQLRQLNCRLERQVAHGLPLFRNV